MRGLGAGSAGAMAAAASKGSVYCSESDEALVQKLKAAAVQAGLGEHIGFLRNWVNNKHNSTVEIFECMSEASRRHCFEHMKLQSYSAGQAIVKKGDLGNVVYFVEEGEALATDGMRGLRWFQEGSFFGDIAFTACSRSAFGRKVQLEEKLRVCDVVATTWCTCWQLDVEHFVQAISNDLSNNHAVMKLLSKVSNQRQQEARTWRGVEERRPQIGGSEPEIETPVCKQDLRQPSFRGSGLALIRRDRYCGAAAAATSQVSVQESVDRGSEVVAALAKGGEPGGSSFLSRKASLPRLESLALEAAEAVSTVTAVAEIQGVRVSECGCAEHRGFCAATSAESTAALDLPVDCRSHPYNPESDSKIRDGRQGSGKVKKVYAGCGLKSGTCAVIGKCICTSCSHHCQ